MRTNKAITYFAWGLSVLVAAIAIFAWGHSNDWHIWPLNIYIFFPVLGLLAWSTMWSQYISGFIRQTFGFNESLLNRYYWVTGRIVLVLICLHPGLLIYQRFRDGFGLPPGSYYSYVMHGLGWVTLVGTASLFVFLAFELRRWFGGKPWWHIVPKAGDAAMLAIFYHSLRLGTQLHSERWFFYVWWFYGLTLMIVLANKYWALAFNKA